jgi:hypothetical protein
VTFTSSCRFDAQVMAELATILDTGITLPRKSLGFGLSTLATSAPSHPYHIAPLPPPFRKARIDKWEIKLDIFGEEAVEAHLPAVMKIVMGLFGANRKIWDPTTHFNPDGLPNYGTFLPFTAFETRLYCPPILSILGSTLAKAAVCVEAVRTAGWCPALLRIDYLTFCPLSTPKLYRMNQNSPQSLSRSRSDDFGKTPTSRLMTLRSSVSL